MQSSSSFSHSSFSSHEPSGAATQRPGAGSVPRWLGILSKLHVVSVLILIFLGGNVKSHEAGLSVPDWPTSYGYNMFTFPYEYWVGGIWHEHVHRLVASGVGALTVLLAIGVWRSVSRYRALAVLMVVAVVVQGLLGGLTVLLHLPAWTSSAHGMLAQGFLCLSVAMAYLLHLDGAAQIERHAVKIAACSLIGALFVQLVFGAFVRHTEAGLAVLDFPTVAGAYIPSISAATLEKLNLARAHAHLPPIETVQVVLHLLHRYWALMVVGAVYGLWRSARRSRDGQAALFARILILLTAIQVTLGATVVLTHRIIWPTSLHVLVGASMMAMAMLTYMATRAVRAG